MFLRVPGLIAPRSSRGHLSILAFHHILTDPRTQDLPLILETPSFEVEEVWRKEVEVLNRISVQPEQEGEGREGEEGARETLKSLEGELRDVVKAAGGSSKTAAKAGSAKKTAKKRKGKDESEDESAGDA
jgi:AP endonuclease 1